MKRILVTGAAGYIGSILCPKLGKLGYELCLFDNLYFNQQFNDVPGYSEKYIGFDVTKLDDIKVVLDGFQPDIIIHLAALVGMPICKKHPELAILTNTESTRLLLDNSSSDVKFIAPNTNSQYGTVEGICTEETPTNPISLYSVTKCISESLILNRPNSVSLRLATVYGLSPTRMRDDLLINFMTKKLVQEGEISIYEPEFNRGACHIEDIANAFIHAIDKDLTGVYNVGDDSLNMTKGELAHKIANIVSGKVTYCEGKDEDQRNYTVSNLKLYNTGFEIQTNFEEEILKLKEYYGKI